MVDRLRKLVAEIGWWSWWDSNPRPSDCQSDALPLSHSPVPVLIYQKRMLETRSRDSGYQRFVPD